PGWKQKIADYFSKENKGVKTIYIKTIIDCLNK
ncbi:unnamed protein product, partial [marine sediment metagenome]